jgi:hypothetical protein
MRKFVLPVLFCGFLTALVSGQNLVEPNWGQFTGAPPEEVAELSEDFGLSFNDLRAAKPNLKEVGAAARSQYKVSTTYKVSGNEVVMTATYYIDSAKGYYASTLEIESSYSALINRQYADWEKLVSETLGYERPSTTTTNAQGKSMLWQWRAQWPAIIIAQPARRGNKYRVTYSQYSQLGQNRGDVVNHKELVQKLTNVMTGGVR